MAHVDLNFEFQDITKEVLGATNLTNILKKFQSKAQAYSLIEGAFLDLQSIEGMQSERHRFLFKAIGTLVTKPKVLPTIRLSFNATAEYRQRERRIYLLGFRSLNDPVGIVNGVLEATGICIGQSLHVSEEDNGVVESLLGGEGFLPDI